MPKTPGEKLLFDIATGSFLKPWVFPNLYFSPGKELADLVVRFDDTLIIFSEKTRAFKSDTDLSVAWKRWKAAIDGCQRQLVGAAKQLAQTPPTLFVDASCRQLAPAHLFERAPKQTFLVAVVRGSGWPTQKTLRSNSASLILQSSQLETGCDQPFAYNPFIEGGKIIHVLDDHSFPLLFKYVNTTPDLVNYLTKKERLLRSLKRFSCHGEEELLHQYMRRIDSDGHHGFEYLIEGCGKLDAASFDSVHWDEDTFHELESSEILATKLEDDRPSYFVDNFINYTFETASLRGAESVEAVEPALRHLASLDRVRRRIIGQHLVEFHQSRHESTVSVRVHFSSESIDAADCAIVLASIIFDDPWPLASSDQTIPQQLSSDVLFAYIATLVDRYPNIRSFVGISFVKDDRETPPTILEGLLRIEKQDIDEDFLAEYRAVAQRLGFGSSLSELIVRKSREYRTSATDSEEQDS